MLSQVCGRSFALGHIAMAQAVTVKPRPPGFPSTSPSAGITSLQGGACVISVIGQGVVV
jgi:hypothetical protein